MKIKTNSFPCRVEIFWPDSKGNEKLESFGVEFKRLPLKEFVARTTEFSAIDDSTTGLDKLTGIVQFLDEVVLRVWDIEADDATPAEIREFLINDTRFSLAIFQAYNDAMVGNRGADEKN